MITRKLILIALSVAIISPLTALTEKQKHRANKLFVTTPPVYINTNSVMDDSHTVIASYKGKDVTIGGQPLVIDLDTRFNFPNEKLMPQLELYNKHFKYVANAANIRGRTNSELKLRLEGKDITSIKLDNNNDTNCNIEFDFNGKTHVINVQIKRRAIDGIAYDYCKTEKEHFLSVVLSEGGEIFFKDEDLKGYKDCCNRFKKPKGDTPEIKPFLIQIKNGASSEATKTIKAKLTTKSESKPKPQPEKPKAEYKDKTDHGKFDKKPKTKKKQTTKPSAKEETSKSTKSESKPKPQAEKPKAEYKDKTDHKKFSEKRNEEEKTSSGYTEHTENSAYNESWFEYAKAQHEKPEATSQRTGNQPGAYKGEKKSSNQHNQAKSKLNELPKPEKPKFSNPIEEAEYECGSDVNCKLRKLMKHF